VEGGVNYGWFLEYGRHRTVEEDKNRHTCPHDLIRGREDRVKKKRKIDNRGRK